MNQIKQLAGQTVIYGLSSIVPRFLNYLLVPFYTRIFAPGEYGVVTELYAYITFLIVILTYGLETGFFRFGSKKEYFMENVFSTAFGSIIVTTSIFLGVILLYTQNIAQALEYSNHPEYIHWLAFTISFDALSAIPFAKLRLMNRPIAFAFIKVGGVIINLLLNFLFLLWIPALIDKGYSGLNSFYNPDIGVGYVFISNLVASGISFFAAAFITINRKFNFSFSILKALLIYSFPLLIAGLAGTVNETLDRILLKHFLPNDVDALAMIGIYGANIKVAVLMTLFIQMFRFAAEPFFFNNAEDKNSPTLFANVAKYFLLFGLVIFLGVMSFIDIIKYFIGEDYRAALDIVPVLLLANLFLGLFFNLSVWYKLTNRTYYGALLTGIGAFVTILINVSFIPEYGYYASAWGHLITYFIMVVLSYLLGRYYFKIPYPVWSMIKYILFALALYFITILIPFHDRVLLNSSRAIIFIIFVVVIYLTESKNIKIILEAK